MYIWPMMRWSAAPKRGRRSAGAASSLARRQRGRGGADTIFYYIVLTIIRLYCEEGGGDRGKGMPVTGSYACRLRGVGNGCRLNDPSNQGLSGNLWICALATWGHVGRLSAAQNRGGDGERNEGNWRGGEGRAAQRPTVPLLRTGASTEGSE